MRISCSSSLGRLSFTEGRPFPRGNGLRRMACNGFREGSGNGLALRAMSTDLAFLRGRAGDDKADGGLGRFSGKGR